MTEHQERRGAGMTDLLVLAEAQIAEKQFKEIEAIKQRLEQDKEILKQAIELVNSHTLYKKVEDSYCRGVYKYVLATEEMLKEDYLGEPKPYCRKGIYFHENSWKERINRGIMEVNGHTYYDVRYALNNYEEEMKDKKRRIDNLYSSIREYEDELKALHRNFPTLKQAVTEWMEYQKEQYEDN